MFDAKEVLKAATINGRRIFGLPANSVEEGNTADFIVAKREEYTTDPVLSIVHRMESSSIWGVFKNGVLINYDQTKITKNYNKKHPVEES